MNDIKIKIGILGGSGQLGNYLSSHLIKYFSITSFSSKSFSYPNINIDTALGKFDIVINCVGYPYRFNTIHSEKARELSRKLNYDFAIFIADYCKKTNKKLIHISTNAVYSSKNIYLHKENEYNKNAVVPYDQHKLRADLYIEKFLINYLILRPYNLHGNPIENKPFFNTLANIINNSTDKIIVVENITAQFVSAKVISNAIIHLININVNGIYNLSTEWVYRVNLISNFLKIINNDRIYVKVVDKEFFKIKQITHGLMNCEKIIKTGFLIPTSYNDLMDWWNNQLSMKNKNNISQSIESIEKRWNKWKKQ